MIYIILLLISTLFFVYVLLYVSLRRNDDLCDLQLDHWRRLKRIEMKPISEHISRSINLQFEE